MCVWLVCLLQELNKAEYQCQQTIAINESRFKENKLQLVKEQEQRLEYDAEVKRETEAAYEKTVRHANHCCISLCLCCSAFFRSFIHNNL